MSFNQSSHGETPRRRVLQAILLIFMPTMMPILIEFTLNGPAATPKLKLNDNISDYAKSDISITFLIL